MRSSIRTIKKNNNGSSNYGKLFYSVILADRECNFGPMGLDNQIVHSIHYKDVGALVSDYPRVDSIKLLRKNLAPYHEVNRKAAEHWTVIPAKFGQIGRDAGEVSIALRKNYSLIRRELEKLEGKVEVGLRVNWDVENVLEYFIQIDDQLRARKERLANGGKPPTQMELIDFGTYFHERMDQFRGRMTEKILATLPHAAARIEDVHDDQMVANVALLVKKDLQTQIGDMLDPLGESIGDEYSLKLEGPWPPFSFVDRLELHLER